MNAELNRMHNIFNKQQDMPNEPARYEDRAADLTKLADVISANKQTIVEAIALDYGHRSHHETLLAEIFPSLECIKYNKKHLKSWMKPEKVSLSKWFKPASGKIIYQPLGIIGIMVPWNYPLFLAVAPLAAALAAGNQCMIKMSELSPNFGAAFQKIIAETFASKQVAVITGDVDVSKAFSSLAFDHLLFTGSTTVGRHVMKAASENLTPVTLELGGKSPTIISEGFPVNRAIKRIMYGKCLNSGQTCVAPDYLFVPETQLENVIKYAQQHVAQGFPGFPQNKDYSHIISAGHYQRLQNHIKDAQNKGASYLPLSEHQTINGETKLAPSLLINTTAEMTIMQEEIFGPILPVLTYKNLDEVIDYINERPTPLALYIFDNNKKRVQSILARTRSGGVAVNDTMLQVAQENMPFGGMGDSGMGEYHGKDGFLTFSKKRPIFIQKKYNSASLLKPPYKWLANFSIKWMLR